MVLPFQVIITLPISRGSIINIGMLKAAPILPVAIATIRRINTAIPKPPVRIPPVIVSAYPAQEDGPVFAKSKGELFTISLGLI